MTSSAENLVRHFRQILLWPLQLMPLRSENQVQRHWDVLRAPSPDHPWRELRDRLGGDREYVEERRYNELVAFLPYVQRFLYGEGASAGRGTMSPAAESPMRVFRRDDVASVRITIEPGEAPVVLGVAHLDLYFFFDIDVVLLVIEVFHDQPLALAVVERLLYRFGRAYPAGWDKRGQGVHCPHLVEWLSADGTVVVASETDTRERTLRFVARHRVPRIGVDWAHLLSPLVLDQSDEEGVLRYRQVEYYRMPLLAYLALDDPRALSRSDFVRLGLVTEGRERDGAPFAPRYLDDFEQRVCYDRFWNADGDRADHLSTRYLCCGHALVIVGDAHWPYFRDDESGVLAQFRHQLFLLFLIAHFQKAALLMFSNELVQALERLKVGDAESVKRFKRTIRQRFEIFLRFKNRYWFHEISEQAHVQALFRMSANHIGLDPLYADVKERIHDMDEYLDSDTQRRATNSMMRLTVVTVFGLIGTITTGFLGMNLIAAADEPMRDKLIYTSLVLLVTGWLTAYTIIKSKRLSDFLDALSDERQSGRAKLRALRDIGRGRPRER